MHDQENEQLQNERNLLRHLAHSTKTADAWKAFRKVRNLLKTKIKEAKRSFINIALSSSKPKAVWRVIHRILNPCPQPLRFDVDELNDHFAGTSTLTAGASTIDTKEDLLNFIGSIDSETPVEQQFTLRPVIREEVLREINRIRLDTITSTAVQIRFLLGRAVEEGGAGGAEPPSTISRGAEHPLYFLQTIYSSVKGSISKIKSPENRQLFMLIY